MYFSICLNNLPVFKELCNSDYIFLFPEKNNDHFLYSKYRLASAENTKSNTNEIVCHLL